MNGSDQDSDSGYTTNQPDIVGHARKCYKQYSTIVNNIPKDKNVYNLSMDDFAKVDNALAGSQRDIGESSNLAQIAQTYMCNFEDKKYIDYVCILSVLAQVAIDNAKRRFDIDLTKEIRRIKNDMDIKKNKYPAFWLIIKKEFKRIKINYELHCAMNHLYDLDLSEFHPDTTTLPMSYFFIKHPLEKKDTIRKSRKVEELIQQYSLKVNSYYNENLSEDYLLLRNDFDNLISDISRINISYNYMGLFCWLLDRAFRITPDICRNNKSIETSLEKNKSVLLKILYTINNKMFLKCFKSC